eukprot:TRINITY_DN580_c0_g1_i1.p1 TRINITY_DN580_c0_g1~~TRINITY_DN580_c0_g1_i1.p1  ORF type:complete len:202 (-),score=51.30 TRINITY_DN580_c0_g1_i1:201-806(-)
MSSNKFANGANQNCGNVITDRSTTRIHAPPGGRSQISFGGYEEPVAPKRRAEPKPAPVAPKAAAPAPVAHTAPSTAMPRSGVSSNKFANGANQNCGNVITDRSTTRIHAPPGGRSQISFGGYEEPVAPKRRAEPKPAPVAPKAAAPAPVAHTAPSTAMPRSGVSSNKFANGANQNCGNVITERSSTRLHAPPGGRSSFTLG